MKISVVAAAREDEQPPLEATDVAVLADRLGYGEVWLGEGPTWDAFALAAAVGSATGRIAITVGPVPVSVRDPFTIVRGAASAEALIGRPVGVALGTSSTRVVEGVHGRSRARPVGDLRDSAAAYQAHRRGEWFGATGTHGFHRRLPPATGPLTIAAFGDRAIGIAARHADRMLLDLVSPAQVRELRAKLHSVTGHPPTLAAWLPAAVDPDDASYAQLMRAVAGYLPVRGYQEVFAAAGFTRRRRPRQPGRGPRRAGRRAARARRPPRRPGRRRRHRARAPRRVRRRRPRRGGHRPRHRRRPRRPAHPHRFGESTVDY